MPQRSKKRKPKELAVNPFLSKPFLKGSKKDLVCYLPPGNVHTGGGIAGPENRWKDERDSELCNRIRKRTGATVRVCWYDVGSSAVDKDGIRKPHMMIRPVYDYAKSMKFERLHFVGYSGGAMLGSSQLVFWPPRPGDPVVKTLVLIAGDVASRLDMPHKNAAFFADRINARTRLIYGTKDDAAKLGAQMWKKRNPNADIPPPYEGGHPFYEDGQFENVTRMVIEWLPKMPAIRRRKAHRIVRRRHAKKRRSRVA